MMNTIVQEVRPLSAKEAQQIIEDKRDQEIKILLKPGKRWAYCGWILFGITFLSIYFALQLSSTYYTWWHTAQFELKWMSVIILVIILLVPSLLTLMCFGMSKTLNVAARTEFFELNMTNSILNGIYRFVNGNREEFVYNLGLLEVVRDLDKEINDVRRIQNEVTKIAENVLHNIDQQGKLISLAKSRELITALILILTHLAESDMEKSVPRDSSHEIEKLKEILKKTANVVPVE